MFWNEVTHSFLPQQASGQGQAAGTGIGTGYGTTMHNGDWRANMTANQGQAGAGMGVGGANPTPGAVPFPSNYRDPNDIKIGSHRMMQQEINDRIMRERLFYQPSYPGPGGLSQAAYHRMPNVPRYSGERAPIPYDLFMPQNPTPRFSTTGTTYVPGPGGLSQVQGLGNRGRSMFERFMGADSGNSNFSLYDLLKRGV